MVSQVDGISIGDAIRHLKLHIVAMYSLVMTYFDSQLYVLLPDLINLAISNHLIPQISSIYCSIITVMSE